jgi:hypothetical protein
MKAAKNAKRVSIDLIWFKDQFDKLHNEHLLILKKIDGIQTVVSPPLENQIRRAANLARSIDKKVPDEAG